MKREDLQPNAPVRGLLTDGTATVVSVQWHAADALTAIFRDAARRVAEDPISGGRAELELVESGTPWSFDGDRALFRLVSKAHRIWLAHLFDPVPTVTPPRSSRRRTRSRLGAF